MKTEAGEADALTAPGVGEFTGVYEGRSVPTYVERRTTGEGKPRQRITVGCVKSESLWGRDSHDKVRR